MGAKVNRAAIVALLFAGALLAGASAVGAAPEGSGPPTSPRAFDTKCGAFPAATDVAADAPSLPDQRAWNQNISGAPVAADSDQIIDYINSHGDSELHPDFGSQSRYGIPFKTVGARTKAVRVKFRVPSESDKGKYKIPLSSPIEGGPNGDGDRHVIAYDKSGCKLYELYQGRPRGRSWKAGSGAIWDLTSADVRTAGFTSADAAGLPIYPGLTRYDEVATGVIDHALRVTFESTRDAYLAPASHCAGDTSSADAPPMGLRLRLKASFDTSALTGQAAVIATALKRYGFINADNGSNWFFSGSSDKGWQNNNLNQLKEIPGKAFEVVRSEGAGSDLLGAEMPKRARIHLRSNLIAYLALIVALGGSGAYAAQHLKKNSVKSKQIKDGQVKTQDIADAAVSAEKLAPGAVPPQVIADGSIAGAKLADGSVTGAKVTNDSLTGTDFVESSLAVGNADSVGGMRIRKINFQVPFGTPIQNVLVYPDIFRIDAQCANNGDFLDISAATAAPNSTISETAMDRFTATDEQADANVDIQSRLDNNFNPNEAFEVDFFPELGPGYNLTLHFSTLDGFVAVTHLKAVFNGSGCNLTGTSIGG